ncbi:MAG: PQQ-binding-like beta-propeller repeat protein [Kiritimatiellia bacterium]
MDFFACKAVRVALALLLPVAVLGSDSWPTFRGDAQRSCVVKETLAVPLLRSWSYKPGQPPLPAWPAPMSTNYAVMHGTLQQTLSFDRAFHVVADEKAVYFGSSSDDSIRALDAASGELRWRFHTEGPVRLPPAIDNGRIYAGSDDGHLYALDDATGELVWKYFAGSVDRRLPGNGRMISLWPVRSGPIIVSNKVYFTAGLFADHGVFLCALDAVTGKEIYKQPLNFTAQGMMLATSDQLFVPTGRTSFWSCDINTGKSLIRYGSSSPWNKNLVGGCFALIHDGLLATGPSEDGQFHWFSFAANNPIFRVNAEHFIVSGESVYLLGSGRLSAYSKAAYLANPRRTEQPVPLWEVDAGLAATMILAGENIVAAGTGEVGVYNKGDGKKLWNAGLDGKAEGLALCGKRLFVSMDDGRTVCFTAGGAGTAREIAESFKDKLYQPNALLEKSAESALKAAGVSKGYCLVMQADTGQLAWEIARRSGFRVVCREEDPAKVKKMRDILAQSGLYGKQIVVHQGGCDDMSYPRHFANLIVSEGALTQGAALPCVKEAHRVLRPCGGVVYIAAQKGTDAGKRLKDWGADLPEWRFESGELAHGIARRGRLPGSGEWSHFYADPANTACGSDEIRPGEMELQWFGRPGPARMVDRHKKGHAPLYVNGRLFVPGFNYIAGVDAYNGVVLWEQTIPDSVRVAAFKDCSGIAATSNELLVAAGGHCRVLDAQTGSQLREIPAVGIQPEQAWGYLAVLDGMIVGSVAKAAGSLRAMGKAEHTVVWGNEQPIICSSSLFAVKQADGSSLWEYRARTGAIANPSITIGNGRVYFIESRNPATLEKSDGRNRIPDLMEGGAALVALDLKNGKTLWSKEVDLSLIKHILYMSYASETLVVTGSRYVGVDPSETKGRPKPEQFERVRYDLFAFDAASGAFKWHKTATPNYDHILDGGHGEQVQHPAIANGIVYGPDFAFHLETGAQYEGWKWKKSRRCATLSMSRHCAFSRFAKEDLPYIFDLETGTLKPLSVATRPGCWINTIPAGGMILIPEASAGCTCPYPIQTSLALTPAG